MDEAKAKGRGGLKALSKKLSWLLRHGSREAGVDMDAAGWVAVAEVLAYTGLDLAQLRSLVASNRKSRLQLDGDRIRACQGHSLEGTPVTLEGLEASWRLATCQRAFHGTAMRNLDSIFDEGLHPAARTHVHLAPSLDAVVGKRAQVEMMLEVDVEALSLADLGSQMFEAPNGVLLCRRVPVSCIVEMHAMTKAARRALPSLRARYLSGATTVDAS